MRAVDLATGLRAARWNIIGWRVLIADVLDLEDGLDELDAYHIQCVKLNEQGEEINLVVAYTDEPDVEDAMTAKEFVDGLLSLASGNPDFAVEAEVNVYLMIEGEQWGPFHMPVRTITGSDGAQTLLLGVDGLRYLKDRIRPDSRE